MPIDGKSSASTSSAPRQRIAPSLRSSCVPAEVSEKIEPGTAKTSRPKSAASLRRDERARAARGFDDDDAGRDSGDDAVADRKVLRPRLGARRVLGEQKVFRSEALFQPAVLARVLHVEAASEDRDRSSGAPQRGLVRRGVHAAREAGNHRHARGRELLRQLPGDVPAIARGVPRAHDRDGRKAQPLEPSQREKRNGGSGISRRTSGYS